MKITGSQSIFLLLIAIPATIWNAFVLTKLYNWFVVTQFDVKQLHIVTAIGIMYMISIFKQTKQWDSFGEGMIAIFTLSLYSLVILISGFIVTLFL